MDDYIIELSEQDYYAGANWEMRLNLKEIAFLAGKRCTDRYVGKGMVDFPMTRAKKLLRLILKHGTEEDLAKCDKYFATNRRLFKYWRDIRGLS